MQWLKEWSAYLLPAVSNLILVLLGVWMSLPKFAEDVEENATRRKWLAVICLVFGITGFAYDVGQRRSSDITNKKLLQNVGTTLGNTNSLLAKLTELEQTDRSLLTVTQLRTLSQPPSSIQAQPSVSIRTQPSVSIRTESLRDRVLLLAKDTLEFLSNSLQHGTAPDDSHLWSTYVDQFGFRVSAIRGDLASAGLADPKLFDISKMHVGGNVAEAVRGVGDTLSNLGALLPPAGLYKDNSDAQLGEAMIQKASVLDEMANKTLKDLENNSRSQLTNPDFIRYDLFYDFNKCCRDAVKNLRGVAVQRLPGAVNQNETDAFLALMRMTPTGSFLPIHTYAPYLRQFGEELKSSHRN